MSAPDYLMQAKIVHLILNKQTEEALEKLSDFYHVDTPEIVVGTIRGKRRTVYAVSRSKRKKNLRIKLRHLLQSFCGVARILSSYKITGRQTQRIRKAG